jgi:hypothetical protein
MKRIIPMLLVILATTTLYAGGKHCDMNAAKKAKSVELTGTLTRGAGAEHAVFRVANDGTTYDVCEKTKASLLELGDDGKATLRVKGKVVNCGEGEKAELMIEEAKKI